MLMLMIKVGLPATVNNAFAEEETTVIIISDITMEYEEYEEHEEYEETPNREEGFDDGDDDEFGERATQKPQGCISRDFHGQ